MFCFINNFSNIPPMEDKDVKGDNLSNNPNLDNICEGDPST